MIKIFIEDSKILYITSKMELGLQPLINHTLVISFLAGTGNLNFFVTQ